MSRAVEAAGFRDTWREIHPDPVAEPGLTWWAEPSADRRLRTRSGHAERPDRPAVRRRARRVTRLLGSWARPGAPDVTIEIDPWPSDHRAVVALVRGRPGPDARTRSRMRAGPSVRPERERRRSSWIATRRTASASPIEVDLDGRTGLPLGLDRGLRGAGRRTCGTRTWSGATPAPGVDGSVRLDAEAAIVDQSSVGGRWPLPPGDYVAAYLLDDGPVVVARVPFRIVP